MRNKGVDLRLAAPGEAMKWINGQWVDASSRGDSSDPATGSRIGSYADASEDDARAAIEAAQQAFRKCCEFRTEDSEDPRS